ncbi:MAG: glycosyltransferase [Gammaproteobacteria bacterium]|nr:glycosyltransferase [Gammaproteobacteria bacterium]
MKILFLTHAYGKYLDFFYRDHPEIYGKSYKEQKKAIDYDGHVWANDFWSHALRPLGYEATEYIVNMKQLQCAWADEQGYSYTEDNWFKDISAAQIEHENPDILFVTNYHYYDVAWLKQIREKCPSIKLSIVWCGAPIEDTTIFQGYDLVLSCIPELVDRFMGLGFKCEHVHHAFEPRLLDRIDATTEQTIDLSFVGQIIRNKAYHRDRERLLEELVSQMHVEIFSPGVSPVKSKNLRVALRPYIYNTAKLLDRVGVPKKILDKIPKIGEAINWPEEQVRPISAKLRPYMKPGVFGLSMFQTLHDSKITYNNHIDVSPRSASNMRLFEATGTGTCLVTDWKENLPELLEPDKEVVTYKTIDECAEKIRWLLDHSTEREAIAKAGQVRTLKDHTFSSRAALLDDIFKRYT